MRAIRERRNVAFSENPLRSDAIATLAPEGWEIVRDGGREARTPEQHRFMMRIVNIIGATILYSTEHSKLGQRADIQGHPLPRTRSQWNVQVQELGGDILQAVPVSRGRK